MRRSRLHWAAVVLLLLSGTALRIYFVQAQSAFMQSDEALFGLMAKHISSRGHLPIFAYGEERSGALVSYLVAPLFQLFGTSNLVFKVVTTLLSLVAVYLVYLLARRIRGNTAGLLAMTLAAFGPPFLIMWSVHAAAEYMLTMVLGASSLLLCDDILFSRRAGPAQTLGWRHRMTYGLLGLVLGLGFWISPLIISFIAAVWVALFLNDRKCFFRTTFLVFLLAFLVGHLPAIVFNALPSLRAAGGMPDAPNWVSYTSLLSGSTEPLWARITQVPGTLLRVATVSMPPMMGGSLWEYETGFWRRSVVVILLSFWFTSIIYTLGARLQLLLGRKGTGQGAQSNPQRWALRPIDPLILQFLLAVLVYSLSQYRWLATEPRYLIPVFAFLLVAGALLLDSLWGRWRILGSAVLALVVVLNVATTVAFSDSLDPDHGLWPKDEQLVQHLIDNDIRHPVAEYWNAYSIAFESDEKVIPVPIGYTKFSMYEDVVGDSAPSHYLFPKREQNDRYFEFFRYGLGGPQWTAGGFRDYLEDLGVPNQAYSELESEHYVLYDVPLQHLDPAEVILAGIPLPKEPDLEIREQLVSIVRPGDGLILNPPELPERLGQPQIDEFAIYTVPDRAPLDEASAGSRLAHLAEDHRRLYLLLGDTSASDPEGYVQGWLNRNAYRASDQWLGDLLLVLYGTTARLFGGQPAAIGEVLMGDWVELTGADLRRAGFEPGEIVPLTLYWQAQTPVPKNLKVFVHLLNANGDLVAQRDSEPVGGLRPTSTWEVGEAVVDRYGVLLPGDLAPGNYRIVAGLYDPATGDRLPVTVDAIVSPDGFYEIGPISVGQ